MKLCPTENELHGLLSDRLPEDVRTTVEGHIETCPVCQRQLDALTQAAGLKLAVSHATIDSGPAFLERLQAQYPATLLERDAQANSMLHFPGPPTERAPLGQVGDFDILQELGSGSFGWVFRARERSLNRIVALKVLKPEMTARPDAIVRFEREARKASLQHDHIVSVYRFEKPAGFPPYLVMEYIAGETLEARLKREGKLAPEEAAAIARQVALGLAAAHEHGMVHRDIKPANILLDKTTGRAKISDFGLARDISDESMAITGAGELAGTAPYMSPEHFRAPEKVDGRSDVFSLGIVLYQLLTGQLPFKGSFLQIRSGILEDEPKSPRRVNDSIPVDLETIALACLEKDPQRRYATAQAVAEDLRRFQNGEPILCRPTGRMERAIKWMYRKPAQAALVGVGNLSLVTFLVLIAGLFVNAQLQAVNKDLADAKDKLLDKKAKLEKTQGELLAQRTHVERLNYVADMNLAYQAFQNDNFRLLDQFLATYDNSDLRGFEWHYLRWLATTDGRRIGPKEPITAIAFHPSSQMLALGVLVGNDVQLQVWQTPSKDKPRGERVHTLAGNAVAVTDIAFHPTQNLLITADLEGALGVWDWKKGQKVQTLEGRAPFAVSPDGQFLAYLRSDGAVQRWSFADRREIGAPMRIAEWSGKEDSAKERPRGSKPDDSDKSKLKGARAEGPRTLKSAEAKTQSSGIKQLAFSADGLRLAAVGGFFKTIGGIAVWDLKSGERLMLEDAKQDDMQTSLAFSPDGQAIAAVGFDHALRVWDAKTGKLRFRRNAHKLEVLSVAFNAAGDRIATAGWDQTVKIWNARTGEELGNLHGNRDIVRQVLFSSDANASGRDHLVSLNDLGELRWWDAGQEQAALVTRHSEPVHALAFSREGRYLASIGRNSQVLIQDLVKPTHYELPVTTPGARGLFSQDENSLFTAGNDGTLQTWPFAKGGNAVDVPHLVSLTGQRIVVRIDNQWLVSQAYPSAQEPLRSLLPFGAIPDPAPVVVAVDAAAERFAFVRDDGGIVLRRRDKETGAVTEQALRAPDATKPRQTVNTLAFSPDGRLLAADNPDYSISLWDTESGNLRHRLTGHLCLVGCAAFSPDGKRLVSGSEDWTVKIWDIEVGRATLTLSGHKGRIRDVAFSPDGKWLASASEDATVRLWPGAGEAAEDRWAEREPSAKLPTQIKRGGK